MSLTPLTNHVVVIGDKLLPVSFLPSEFNRQCHGIKENLEQGLITGINDTGDNLLPVTMMPAINTKQQILQQIFVSKLPQPRILRGQEIDS
jgi:hypothetical protein